MIFIQFQRVDSIDSLNRIGKGVSFYDNHISLIFAITIVMLFGVYFFKIFTKKKDVALNRNYNFREPEKEIKYLDSVLNRNNSTAESPKIAITDQVKEVVSSIPEPNHSLPKRIGYLPSDDFQYLESHYPYVKMPNEYSLIKFPRNGRSDKRGFTEDAFLLNLKDSFNSSFQVFNDKHIPTTSSRPYEPDFVLSTEVNGKNIFIDIEVDEPYDGYAKMPTHCIGENTIRDNFFTIRGWIVIRFAEIQIHNEPEKCCAFIARVIKSIDSSFNHNLLDEAIPNLINQWDNIQANKWAKEKYREKYLGIDSFGQREMNETVFNISPSEVDNAVEATIPKPIFTRDNSSERLKLLNLNQRDSRIEFDPEEHRYYIDGNADTISVTQLIDKHFPIFDSKYWSTKGAVKRLKASNKEITEENVRTEQNVILKVWNDKKDLAATKGTELHKAIEDFYNGESPNLETKEFGYFKSFVKSVPNLTPYRSEWKIFDEDLMIAGTVDMVYKKDDNSLVMFDWKRSEKVVYPPLGDRIKLSDPTAPFTEFGYQGLSHLTNDSYNKYALQQNIYKEILERKYNFKISTMNLLILHESYESYVRLIIPDLKNEVNYIFKNCKR